MSLQLMSLEIDLGFEDDKLFLQALPIGAEEVVLFEMLLQRVVVHIVLLLPAGISSVTDMTSFMLVSAMGVKLIVTVESLPAKSTLRMTPEATLINCARVIIAKLLMFAQFLYRKELMLMSEHLLVSRAQITHHFLMYTLDMAM